jgi:hypothetical protein
MARIEDVACGAYDRYPEENWLVVPICHLSRFALFGEVAEVRDFVYSPLATRNWWQGLIPGLYCRWFGTASSPEV